MIESRIIKNNKRIQAIEDAMFESGKVALKHFRHGEINYIQKTTIHEITTPVDLEIEKILKSRIKMEFPNDGILAEESPEKVSGAFWTVDPLDGSSYFQRGLADWSIHVARIVDREVVIAMTLCPVTGEFYYSEKGKGAYMNGERIHVSEKKNINEGIFFFGHNYLRAANDLKSIELRKNVRAIWSTGSTALALCNLAAGRLDIGIQTNQCYWDITGMLHVIEAGGKFTNWEGQMEYDQSGQKTNNILATNGKLHEVVLGNLF